MKQEKQQEIALMRYGTAAPIIAGLDERYPNKAAFYTDRETGQKKNTLSLIKTQECINVKPDIWLQKSI